MFIRFVIYSLAFYFLMKAARIVVQYFKGVSHKEKPHVTQQRGANNHVNKKDIVEAEFEDITDKD